MFKRTRVLALAMAVCASLVVGAAPALAAAPSNDTIQGATQIAGLPFSATEDTTEATTDAVDTEANAGCGAPVTLASVWFDYTPDAYTQVLVDVSQSDFPAGIIVVQGDPGSLNLISCGPSIVAFEAYAGTTYHIMAFSDTEGINGGTLQIKVDLAPPPPTIAVALSPTGKVDPKTGITTITGTVDCTSSEAAIGYTAEVDITVRQPVGRLITVTGDGYAWVECGSAVPFSITVVPASGIFKPGSVSVSMSAYYCDDFGCAFDDDVVAVRIKNK